MSTDHWALPKFPACCVDLATSLVIDWIKQLQARGLVRTRTNKEDRRRTVITLTTKGVDEIRHLRKALVRMGETSQALMDEAAPGLFHALWRMEQACRRESFDDRLRNSSRAPTD